MLPWRCALLAVALLAAPSAAQPSDDPPPSDALPVEPEQAAGVDLNHPAAPRATTLALDPVLRETQRGLLEARRPAIWPFITLIASGAAVTAAGSSLALAFALGGTGDVGFTAFIVIGVPLFFAATGVALSVIGSVYLSRAIEARRELDEPDHGAATASSTPPAFDPIEHDRLLRMGVTLLGGAVGALLPMAVGWGLQDALRPCGVFGRLCDVYTTVGAALLPITVGVGLLVPHRLQGGRAGMGFGLAGAFAGYLAGAGALGLGSAIGRSGWATRPGTAAAGGVLLSALGLTCGVAAMELRHDALVAGARDWSLWRIFASDAAFLGAAVLGELVAIGISAALASAIFPKTYTSDYDHTYIAFSIAGGAINLLGRSLAGWGVHRALKGRGSAGSALLGTLAGVAFGGAFLGVHVHAPPAGGIFSGDTLGWVPVVFIAGLLALSGPGIALEWSSAASND